MKQEDLPENKSMQILASCIDWTIAEEPNYNCDDPNRGYTTTEEVKAHNTQLGYQHVGWICKAGRLKNDQQCITITSADQRLVHWFKVETGRKEGTTQIIEFTDDKNLNFQVVAPCPPFCNLGF